MKPLEGIIVLEFSQFLSGPSAALRLADLGARVIKVERKTSGDPSRKMNLNNLDLDDDSVLFQTINRNKESYTVNLKDPDDIKKIKKLISYVDVIIENFRPGTMEKFGLTYEETKKIKPNLIYGRITGYGKEGPWVEKPGQDLLVQSLSGLAWLNGNADQPPMPFALAVADIFAGAHLVQGILAGLIQRGDSDEGTLIEVSLIESLLDFQFEVLTTYLNDDTQLPTRSNINNAHAYLPAPYGIYETKDGYIALAMGSVTELGSLLECSKLSQYTDSKTWFSKRDEIKLVLVNHLKKHTTNHWIKLLEPNGYWCSDVYTWDQLFKHDGFKSLEMVQEIIRPNGSSFKTTRCPISIDEKEMVSKKWAPKVGENNSEIEQEFYL